MKKVGLNETKLFHFYRIFKTGAGEGGGVRANPLNPLWIRHCHNLYKAWRRSFRPTDRVTLTTFQQRNSSKRTNLINTIRFVKVFKQF